MATNDASTPISPPKRVAIIGSGNFASAMSIFIGKNAQSRPEFEDQVNMWVFEEEVNGQKLTEIINTTHENVKYLPGIKLPENIKAVPDLTQACQGANLMIFCLPHQFIVRTCQTMIGHFDSKDAYALSMIKGFHIKEGPAIQLVTEHITEHLHVPCASMMGANLANEIAQQKFCETTIGCENAAMGALFKRLLETEDFRVNVTRDFGTVEMCGALKNIVAVGAGFVDGIDGGNNTKACVIRLGLVEMVKFVRHFFPQANSTTFFESCGVADLITTCYGGRNRQVAEAFARAFPNKKLEDLESEILNGQKLQGPLTAHEVYDCLVRDQVLDQFPLFATVHRICISEQSPQDLIAILKAQPSSYGVLDG